METVDLNFRFNATGNAVPELRRAQGAVKRLDSQIQQSNARMRGFNNGITTMQANTRKFSMGALQQAGYQVGDYAVQIANGTSKMQAFGQQAPQFLQIFGPIGAIVGAGVAIFSAFAVAIQKTKEASKEATVEVISFGASVRRLQQINTASIAENLSAPAKAAMSEYSGLLDLMREVAEEQRVAALSKFVEEIAPGEGIARLQKQLEAARKNASMLSQSVIDANEGIANAAQSNEAGIINQLQDQRTLRNVILSIQGKTRDEAAKSVSTAIDSLNQSGLMTKELRAQIQAFAEQNGLLLAAQKKAENLTDAAEEGAEATARSAEAAAQLKAQMSFAASQARAFSAAISAVPTGLQAMKNQTAVIQAEINAISAGYTQIGASSAAYRKQRELELGLSEAGSLAENAYISAIINKDVEAFEARARANEQLSELSTSFDKMGESGSKAASNLAGKINKELTPEMMRLKSVQETVSSTFESGFMSMIDGTKSVKDAFKSMASEIIKELLRVYVVQQITGMISNAIGGFGGAPATSLRPVARPSFAGGGYTGNGARAGGLDGKGGYMAMIHPRETVVDHTKGQSGGGGVTVIQNNTFGSGVSRAEVNAMLPKIVEATKAAVADAKLRGGSYGRSFA